MKYLVVKCTVLEDQYECDADRTPIYVGDDYAKYDQWGYEVYTINDDGSLTLIRDYEVDSKECVCVCIYGDDDDAPEQVIDIKDGGKEVITNDLIKKLKKEYGFTDSIHEIMSEIKYRSAHGEMIGDKWVVMGVRHDSRYPTGY